MSKKNESSSQVYPTLTKRLIQLPGVGPSRAEVLASMGLFRVAELIKHLPYRWERHSGTMLIQDAMVDQLVSLQGELVTCRFAPGGRYGRGGKGRFEAKLEDSSGQIQVIWFNGGYLRDQLHPGMKISVEGKIGQYQNQKQVINPRWRILEDELSPTGMDTQEKLNPIYPVTEGIRSRDIQRLIQTVLPGALKEIEDHFQASYRDARALPTLPEAYRMLHQPEDEDEINAARRRLAYDEVFMLQLGLMLKKMHQRLHEQSRGYQVSDVVYQELLQIPGFELTQAQRRTLGEIIQDIARPYPMNRLLQGDVGSGKTVVALLSMLAVILDGGQCALMAPTEILAEQHERSILRFLEDTTVKVALLTGSLQTADRTKIENDIASGEVDLVIGTHALISQVSRFKALGLVIIDEQHRFGVQQRATMRQEHDDDSEDRPMMPHYLVMTATPIPRTLGMTVFGDLEVSTIDERPPGRQPIHTEMIHEDHAMSIYESLPGRIQAGERVYIVLPTIEEGSQGLRAVTSHLQMLKEGPLESIEVEALHGRMPVHEREAVMARFKSGKTLVLVSTTVIEVGVDVPEASIMIIEHADRFGLAQLHQLRGRVGRGEIASTCYLIANPKTEDAEKRLDAIVQTNDGFQIAEADFEIRGMGEMSGMKQSGATEWRVARLPEDLPLLQMARRDAMHLIESDPDLSKDAHELLKKRFVKQYGRNVNFIDVG